MPHTIVVTRYGIRGRRAADASHGRLLSESRRADAAAPYSARGRRLTPKAKSGDERIAEPTVFLVEDNAGIRRSLRTLMALSGLRVESYGSAAEFLTAYDPERPGCLLLDGRLRTGSSLDLKEELHRNRTAPVIVMTAYADVWKSVRTLKGRAALRQPARSGELLAKIHDAIEIDRRVRQVSAERLSFAGRLAQLTPRERQVMPLLAVGRTSKEIATELMISPRTVEGHRRMTLRKMGVSSATELARLTARLEVT